MTRTRIASLAMVLALALPGAGSAADPPGTFKLGDTTLRLYGYAEVYGIYDLSGSQSRTDFDWASAPAGLPLDGSAARRQSPQFFSTVATSRVGFTTSTPTGVGVIGTKIEGDFNGAAGGYSSFTNSTFFRIRQAYGTVGDWFLVGQTWSTFIDLASYPDTVDFNPPSNNPLVRQPMVRLTAPVGPAAISIAAEQPSGSPLPGGYVVMPDFVAAVTVPFSFGHISARGVTINYHNEQFSKQGFAGALSGDLKLGGDTFVWEVQGGPGIGRYMWGTGLGAPAPGLGERAVVNAAGNDVLLWNAIGYHAGYTHVWSPAFRSNLIWSQMFVKNDADIRAATDPAAFGVSNQRIDQGFVNTFWTFAPNASVGLEYMFARRYTFDGQKGTQNRINGVFHFNFF